VLLYLSLGVADVYLMIHYGRKELEPSLVDGGGGGGGGGGGTDQPESSSSAESEDDRVPALIY